MSETQQDMRTFGIMKLHRSVVQTAIAAELNLQDVDDTENGRRKEGNRGRGCFFPSSNGRRGRPSPRVPLKLHTVNGTETMTNRDKRSSRRVKSSLVGYGERERERERELLQMVGPQRCLLRASPLHI